MSSLILTPVKPWMFPVMLEVVGEAQDSGGDGGWVAVERPMRQAAAEWTGLSERLQTIPVAIDGRARTGRDPQSVEARCQLLESYRLPTAATGEPPILAISGVAVWGTDQRWVVDGLEKGQKIFDSAGRRISQDYTLVLREYLAPVVVRSAAKRVRDRNDKK